MSTIGSRLRDERKRIGLSQVDCANACGVHRRTQGNYELDKGRPDTEYLRAFAELGADVGYVEFGIRAGQVDNLGATQSRLLACLLTVLGYPDPMKIVLDAYSREQQEVQDAVSKHGDQVNIHLSTRGTQMFASALIVESSAVAVMLAEARELNVSLLGSTLDVVDQAVAATGVNLTADKKGRLVAAIYRNAVSLGRVDAKMASDAVELAA